MISSDFSKKSIHDATFVVVDFETVTPSGRPPEPMELAAMYIHEDLKINKDRVFNSLMRLPNEVTLTAFDIAQTGIRQDEVNKAKSQEDVFESFEGFIPSSEFIFVAQNASYEASIITRFCDVCKRSSKMTFIDTIKIAKYLIPTMKDYKLDSLSQYFSIPIALDRHRALPDVEMTARVFVKLLQKATQEKRINWVYELVRIASIPPKKPESSQGSLF